MRSRYYCAGFFPLRETWKDKKYAMIRIDKYLADAGFGSRTQVKELIRKKQVLVNGTVVCRPEEKIDPLRDRVAVQGEAVNHGEFCYYMLNKPAGLVSATKDEKEKTVLSLFDGSPGRNLFPVGRLDKDTTGLLLITDDGALAHRLLSPRHHVDKTYFVIAEGRITEEDVRKLETGVEIGEKKPTMPAEVSLMDAGESESAVFLTIREGKFHQVKRMFAALGHPVRSLKRIAMGSLKLDATLKEGSFRPLTEEEINALKNEPSN